MRKDFQARELTMEVIVGAFMVMVLLGLGYFTIILSREAWFAEKYIVNVTFEDVMGLREGDSVVVRGMPIGKIKGLGLDHGRVHVVLSLDQRLHMKKDYRITIVSTSILGGRYLQVEEGSGEFPDLPEGLVFLGEEPYDLMADAAELMNAAKRSVVEGGMMENFRVASEEVRSLTERLNGGKGMIGHLLSEDDTLYRDLVAGVAALRGLAERIEKGEGTLGQLMSADDTLYQDLAASIASLRSVAERVAKGEGMVGKLVAKDDGLYDDLVAAVGSLRSIAEGIEKGEGTIGRLIKDDGVYVGLEETLNEARATIDDYRETSPVTTFTSVFFGAF